MGVAHITIIPAHEGCSQRPRAFVRKIKAMVESGKGNWDLCDRNNVGGIDLGAQGLLEEVDYTRVDANAVREISSCWKRWLGAYLYSFAMAWDTKSLRR